jgi:hypothetical protein
MKHAWRVIALACALGALLVLPSLAAADQLSNSQSALFHNVDGTCDGAYLAGATASGNIASHRNQDGTTTINISIRNGQPNTTYYPNILCVSWFGALTTNSQGNGAGHYVVDGVPPTFTVSLESAYNPNTGDWSGVQDTYASAVLTAGS